MKVCSVLEMLLVIFGLLILLMTLLQNVGADDSQNLMLSDDQYLNVVVFIWKIFPEYDDRELLGHGALIASNWILITKACHEIILKSNNTVISTGSSYFDDMDINFSIRRSIIFPSKSQFTVIVIDAHIKKSSSFQLFHMEPIAEVEYFAVLVGWNKEKDQPMIEPFAFEFNRQGRLIMKENNGNQSFLNSSAGGIVIMAENLIAISYFGHKTLIFNRITRYEPKNVALELSKRKEEKAILRWQSDSDVNKGIAPEDYINILVSLWRIKSGKIYDLLCLGALIKSNLILVTTQCSEMLNPHENVGVLTGMNDPSDTPVKMLNDTQLLRKNSKLTILTLNRNIELSSSIRIGVVTTPIHETYKYGVFLGWNKQRGRIKKTFHYKNEEKSLLVSGVESFNDENFPPSSIAIRGRCIIGFTYLEERNNVDDNGIVQETTTSCGKKMEVYKIPFPDFTEVHTLLQEVTNNNNYEDLTDDDYFNFVVSLWAKNISEANTPEEIEQKKFDLICLGALLHENAVLINKECHSELGGLSLDDIGILTKSMLPSQPKTKVFDENRLFRADSFYHILHMDQDFMAFSRIRLDWWEEDDTEKINGVLIGWNKEKGPVKVSFRCSGGRQLFIPLSEIRIKSNFPRGSLVIMGENFRGSTITERIDKKEGKRGVFNLTKCDTKDFIWTYKYQKLDSRKARTLLRRQNRLIVDEKGTCEIGSSTKKHRLQWESKLN